MRPNITANVWSPAWPFGVIECGFAQCLFHTHTLFVGPGAPLLHTLCGTHTAAHTTTQTTAHTSTHTVRPERFFLEFQFTAILRRQRWRTTCVFELNLQVPRIDRPHRNVTQTIVHNVNCRSVSINRRFQFGQSALERFSFARVWHLMFRCSAFRMLLSSYSLFLFCSLSFL